MLVLKLCTSTRLFFLLEHKPVIVSVEVERHLALLSFSPFSHTWLFAPTLPRCPHARLSSRAIGSSLFSLPRYSSPQSSAVGPWVFPSQRAVVVVVVVECVLEPCCCEPCWRGLEVYKRRMIVQPDDPVVDVERARW